MSQRLEIYKCDDCGNIVEIVHGANGELLCCGAAMQLMTANTVDAAKEKHVPVIEQSAEGCLVKVGEVEHPMTDAHYIEWIDLIDGNNLYRKFLAPGDKPEALFTVKTSNPVARAYCNLHGLWKK